jgi:protease-4
MVGELGHVFLADVLKARGARLKAAPAELESGRIWTSDQALAMGLIDQQGVMEDLKETTFKGLAIKAYAPPTSAAKFLGVEEMLRNVVADVMGPAVR